MSQYVFAETWEKEKDRLAKLEEWLDPGTTRILETIGVGDGWSCLEVGAGAGSITRWMCERVGAQGSVTAIDIDTTLVDTIKHPRLTVLQRNLLTDDLPGEFDVAHARLLVEHLPEPEVALARMISCVKPGGWVLIEDLDMVTHVPVTPSETYERVSAAATTIMSAAGFNPYLGRSLQLMLSRAGLEDVQAEGRIPIGRRENNPGIEMFQLTLTRLRAPAVAAGLATNEDFDEALALLSNPEFIAMPPSIIAAWGRVAT